MQLLRRTLSPISPQIPSRVPTLPDRPAIVRAALGRVQSIWNRRVTHKGLPLRFPPQPLSQSLRRKIDLKVVRILLHVQKQASIFPLVQTNEYKRRLIRRRRGVVTGPDVLDGFGGKMPVVPRLGEQMSNKV